MYKREIPAREELTALAYAANAEGIHADLTRLLLLLENAGPEVSQDQTREHEYLDALLREFAVQDTDAFKYLRSRNFDRMPHKDLLAVTQTVAGIAGLGRLDRASKRSKRLLIKWMDAHWAVLHPVFEATYLAVEVPE
jgi:hypothetical protein